MQNVTIKTEGTELVIRVDLTQDLGPSKSGKTILIGSTGGNAKVATPQGEVNVGLNVYRKR